VRAPSRLIRGNQGEQPARRHALRAERQRPLLVCWRQRKARQGSSVSNAHCWNHHRCRVAPPPPCAASPFIITSLSFAAAPPRLMTATVSEPALSDGCSGLVGGRPRIGLRPMELPACVLTLAL
jgi:hypothetical protein